MSRVMAEGRIRVLVVDDSRSIRQRLVESIAGLDGVDVVGEAANCQQGMELFQTLAPDVLIVDIKMPGENGFELLEAIEGLDHGAKVIVLTNYPHEIYRRRCMALGVEFFFEKASEYQKIEQVLIKLRSQGGYAAA